MIKEIRAVCEKYHEMGVDSFPHGNLHLLGTVPSPALQFDQGNWRHRISSLLRDFGPSVQPVGRFLHHVYSCSDDYRTCWFPGLRWNQAEPRICSHLDNSRWNRC
ncbi:hypothetical protein L596_003187 [Steinernema carpocapsae]|uniref:Uncharacterized protein n=1 Tax=Steinernema carpocapsae TaxID=34508 RepID=A0A4U8UTD0_STECR|nr:hypothetical protein L596_003187 [Steinernema carpocapsae]